jgi:hypothetical protein
MNNLFFLPVLLVILCFSSCTDEYLSGAMSPTNGDIPELSAQQHSPAQSSNLFSWYDSLDPKTLWELQQARAATARYRDLDNALADGYQDIAVDVEQMGHHYMNFNLVDGTFDLKKPEILVYNRLEDGTPVLIAVEYAIPITDPKPEGFFGHADVWNGNSPFPFWLVHAWVWMYNPEGAFNWTNPLVHLN